MNYYPVNVNLSSGAKDKLRRAILDLTPITIQLSASDLNGNDTLYLTARQKSKIERYRMVKKGLRLNLSSSVLKKNKMKGGNLGEIFKAIGPSIGSFLGGLLKGDDDKEKKKKKRRPEIIVIPQAQPVIMTNNGQSQPMPMPPPQQPQFY